MAQSTEKLQYLCNNMPDLHKIWHNDAKHVPGVHGCKKFNCKKSRQQTATILKIEKS